MSFDLDRCGREWLDAQYNARARIPDHESVFERWRRDSDAVREASSGVRAVSYGPDPAQVFDVYPADEPTGADPVLVFVHGGYWQSLDRSMFGYLAPAWTSRGVAFVSLEYRLAPSASMDEIVDDVRLGIAEIGHRGAGLGVDPGRLYLAGHSAGGHLVAMMAAERWPDHGLPADLVRGGCAISGLYDLEPIRRCYLNDTLGMDAATARRNSPVERVPAASGPLVVTHGGDESAEFSRQEADLVSQWSADGLPIEVVDMPDGHHFDAVDRLGVDGPLLRAVEAVIRSRRAT